MVRLLSYSLTFKSPGSAAVILFVLHVFIKLGGLLGHGTLKSAMVGRGPPTPTHCSLGSFSWMGDQRKFDVLFYLIILWIYTCRSLVPEGPWCVFYVVFCWYPDLISHMQTNTHTTQCTQWSLHPNKYIFTPCAMCSHQRSLLQWKIHSYQNFTFQNVFSSQKLFTGKSDISVD